MFCFLVRAVLIPVWIGFFVPRLVVLGVVEGCCPEVAACGGVFSSCCCQEELRVWCVVCSFDTALLLGNMYVACDNRGSDGANRLMCRRKNVFVRTWRVSACCYLFLSQCTTLRPRDCSEHNSIFALFKSRGKSISPANVPLSQPTTLPRGYLESTRECPRRG